MKRLIPLLILLSFCSFPLIPAKAASGHRVVIVIDDFGNNMKGTKQMLSLPIPLTAAVMPFLPSTKQDAISAHKKGYEVIVHLPMEPYRGKKSWLGPNAITTDLSDKEIRKRVTDAIEDVPYAIGMNNHMGSKATADERIMRIVLTICKERGLFYLDSRTNSQSLASTIGKELGVPVIENELFFDDLYTHTHVTKQANVLLQKIQTDPVLVAIGHVGPPGEITSRVLSSYIPKIKEKAHFVFLSELAPVQTPIPMH
ncbi:divergent polysaccharide deacetylase family protein [Bacillus sp. 165]|nr:divergent polysaccharide deacetylase family protein [Bacillus sp. 165]MBO9128448.1 divergent polysaccharide deacetylase family protein [Bacillus sp. 165]